MAYPYEDLDDVQFERLVVECARKIFGIAVQSFSSGVDGGRDARFEGTAERFPSTTAPWNGLTIFQAKHTNATNVHYSDNSFSGDGNSATLTEEIARIKALVDAGSVDNYFLVANRRLGAVSHEKIKRRISAAAGLQFAQVFLAGTEYLDDLLRQFPEVITLSRIDRADGPLLVSSSEIAEVIIAISHEIASGGVMSDSPVVDRVSFANKNKVNNLTPEFAKTLSDRYLQYTAQFDKFLANPMNAALRELYDSAVDEFQLKIVAHRQDYQTFDRVFNYLVDLLFSRDVVLARNKKLTRAMLFYMYWHCDIGEAEDATAQ